MADQDWANGSDLANLSRGGDVLQQMGYDPDDVRMNAGLRAEVMAKLGSPYAAPRQVAQNTPPPPITSPNPRSQNGNDISAPTGAPRLFNRQQPTAPPQPVPETLGSATLNASTPPTSASVSPTGTSTPSPDVANARTAAANLLAPEPTAPDTSAQDAMIASHSVPLNPRDPLYKEGKLGKFGRGLEAAAVGFGRGGVPASVMGAADPATEGVPGYGAPNSGYGIDEQTRQAQLALANKQKTDMMAKFKTQTDVRKQQDTASHDAGEIANTTADLPNKTTTANADAARAYNDSPAGKSEAAKELNQVNLDSRKEQIADPKSPLAKLSSADKAYFLASGKVPDPDTYHAPADQVLFYQALGAWKRDNPGKEPGLDAIRTIAGAAKGADPEETNRIRTASATLAAASKRLVEATAAQTKSFGQARIKANAEVDAAQKAYDDAVSGMDKPASAAAPAAQTTPPGAKPKLVSGAWQGMEKPHGGEVAVTAPDGTPGYATPAWLKTPAGKGFKRASQ